MSETEKKQYQPSKEAEQLKTALDQQEQTKPDAYQSAWQSQLDLAMERILNREPFSYSLNGDALYQQYKDQAVRDGRLAMMDTMGQASAMTGGYGNSYAQSVGQQAYHQQLQGLYDRIPELYSLALEQYDRQAQAERQQMELLMQQENRDYSRYRDGVSDWQKESDRLWDRYNDERGFGYDAYRDTVKDEQWLAEFEEAKRRYDQEWAVKYGVPSGGGSSSSSYSGSGGSTAVLRPETQSYDQVLANSIQLMQGGASYQNIQNYLTSQVNRGAISGSDVSTINRKVTEVRDSRG